MVLPNINKKVMSQEEAVQKALSVSQNRGNPMIGSIPGGNESEEFEDEEVKNHKEHSIVRDNENVLPRQP